MKNIKSMNRISILTLILISLLCYPPLNYSSDALAKQTMPDLIPTENPSFSRPELIYFNDIGQASYYSYECANLPMANGQIFDPEKNTCASWFYEFGTILIVTSIDTGLSTEVVVTDRGPNERLVKRGRIIDLSRKAFEDICMTDKGLTNVVISVKSSAKAAS